MTDLEKLYQEVGRFPSCRMNSGQVAKFQELNALFNKLSGLRVLHQVCNKPSLMVKVKHYIHAENNKQIKQPKV